MKRVAQFELEIWSLVFVHCLPLVQPLNHSDTLCVVSQATRERDGKIVLTANAFKCCNKFVNFLAFQELLECKGGEFGAIICLQFTPSKGVSRMTFFGNLLSFVPLLLGMAAKKKRAKRVPFWDGTFSKSFCLTLPFCSCLATSLAVTIS
jgi:hypothetical protein